jgi:adenylosuccinate synthase
MFSGKSTTASLLHEELGFVVVSARYVLRDLATNALWTRADLQRFGSELELRTNGKWLADAAAAVARASRPQPVVVDSARTRKQVDAVRDALGDVYHVHLTAPSAELRRRFDAHRKDVDESASFEQSMQHPVEQEVLRLAAEADLVLDSEAQPPHSLVRQILQMLTEL